MTEQWHTHTHTHKCVVHKPIAILSNCNHNCNCNCSHRYRYKTVFIVGLLAIYASILGRTTRPNMPVYIAKRPIMTVVFSVI